MNDHAAIMDEGRDRAFVKRVQTGIEREFSAFRHMLERLVAEHNGEFVAFSDGKLIDQDKDEFALAERVSRKYPRKLIFIQKIGENLPERISVITTERGV